MMNHTRQAAFRSDRGQELYSVGLTWATAHGYVDGNGRVCNPARVIVKTATDRALCELWSTARFMDRVQYWVARAIVRAEKRQRPGATRE